MDKLLLLSDELPDEEVLEALASYKLILLSSLRDLDNTLATECPGTIIINQNSEDSLDICRLIKSKPEARDIPVLILSDYSDAAVCFEAGADDFLLKPVNPVILKSKVLLLFHTFEIIQSLKVDQKQASDTALQAMRSSSELGRTIQFVEKCSSIHNEETMGKEIIRFCSALELKVVLSLLKEGEWYITGTNDAVSPLEQDILPQLHDKGRFVDFGTRTQINFHNVALLIKNMPTDDPARYGQIKDLLPSVLSVVDSRLGSVHEARAIREQTELMNRSFEAMFTVLETVTDRMAQISHANRYTMAGLLEYMYLTIPKLSLEDDQEEFILGSLDQVNEFTTQVTEESDNIKFQLGKISQVLETLMKKQNLMSEMSDYVLEEEDVELKVSVSEDGVDLF